MIKKAESVEYEDIKVILLYMYINLIFKTSFQVKEGVNPLVSSDVEGEMKVINTVKSVECEEIQVKNCIVF